jgi:hypothetical protein
MLKLLRKFRRRLLYEKNISRYIIYALGEIVLVVIGILIALQINNWQQAKNDRSLEKRYLQNLVSELEKDSIGLQEKYALLVEQSEMKNPLLSIIENGHEHDSLLIYFRRQWQPIYSYTPLKSTYEEMTSSSHLNIIRPDTVRESIIRMYNAYENLKNDEDFLMKNFENLIQALSKAIPDIYEPSMEEILSTREDNLVMNSIRLNGAFSRRRNYERVLAQCIDLLKNIRIYQRTIK